MSRSQNRPSKVSYDAVGVNTLNEEKGLAELGRWVTQTFSFNPSRPLLELGFFANVLPLTAELGLAISTDGVGTKLLIAQELDKYDTVGIDCVAMNANDVICVGARPISMVDYIAVQKADPHFLGEIAKGLCEGAKAAGINIPGGEIAQVREMIQGSRPDHGFDLVGTCIGTVHPNRLIVGEDIQPGDLIVGMSSTGVHSNGLTLARNALLHESKLRVSDSVPELGRTVGEELLVPTKIYVKEIVQMMDEGLRLKALIHITSDGFLNLARVKAPAGFVLDKPLNPHPIFTLIAEGGRIDDEVMYQVFNMGTGFCVIVDPGDAKRVESIAKTYDNKTGIVGYTVHDPERRVWLPTKKLVGKKSKFSRTNERAPRYPLGRS
jgi:phosphoribosylformylglycinamidine cyclo-ligase